MPRNRRLLREGELNFCYLDESGTGNEPIATMVGVLVDAGRMRLTKTHWEQLLDILSGMAGKKVAELHTADFYAGNGVWRDVSADVRVSVVDAVLDWLSDRKHHLFYTSVLKKAFFEDVKGGRVPVEINTPYRFMAFHLVLAVQKCSQHEKKNKGNTVLVFDNEEKEKLRFSGAVSNPPVWSNAYYGLHKKKKPLNQIIDAPYWADSKEVCLLQVADFLAFFLRRYAEIEEGLVGPKYEGERARIRAWMEKMKGRCLDTAHLYPKRSRNGAQELFYCHAPNCVREL